MHGARLALTLTLTEPYPSPIPKQVDAKGVCALARVLSPAAEMARDADLASEVSPLDARTGLAEGGTTGARAESSAGYHPSAAGGAAPRSTLAAAASPCVPVPCAPCAAPCVAPCARAAALPEPAALLASRASNVWLGLRLG